MRRRVLIGLAAGCAAAVVLGGPAGAQQPKDVVIGVIIPLTGPAPGTGQDVKAGAEFGADLVNGGVKGAEGSPLLGAGWSGIPGLGGAKVKLVFADSQASPEVGRAEAERLITTVKPSAIMGAWHSGVTVAIAPVAERYRIPHASISTALELTQRGFQYFFRVGVNSAQGGEVLFQYLDHMAQREGKKGQKLGILHEDTASGVNFAKAIEEMARAKSIPVTLRVSYSREQANMDSEILKLKSAGIDLLVQSSYTSDGIIITRTMRKLDYAPALIFSQGGFDDDPKWYEAVGDDANFGSKRQLWSPALSATKPILKVVNDEFRKRYGRDINDNSVRYISMVQVLADAMNRARSADPPAIQKALVTTDLKAEQLLMVHGVRFDDKHDNVLAKAMVAQIQERQPKIVFPPEAAMAKPVWPIPAWSRR
jgi:branched-chain amino acid transport system substrate-binding protein